MDTPERRRAPRYELVAQASIASGDEAFLLPVRNISTTGAFLEGSPADYPDLRQGVALEVTLSASDPSMSDEDVVNVRRKASVARVEPARAPRAGGFGLTLAPASPEDAVRLQTLVGHLAHLPPPRPVSPRG